MLEAIFVVLSMLGVAVGLALAASLALRPRAALEAVMRWSGHRRKPNSGPDTLLASIGRLPPYRWLLSGNDPIGLLSQTPNLQEFPRLVIGARLIGLLTLSIAIVIVAVTITMSASR